MTTRDDSLWHTTMGDEPLIASAVHDGHDLRDEVAALMHLSNTDRLREEDPHTGMWAEIADTRIIARRSRFECDINRPRERAVYVDPEDAWGLHVWKERPDEAFVARSLDVYDQFYGELGRVYEAMTERFGCVLSLDLHTYNHQRGGPGAPYDDPEANPEVNIGTRTMDRERWAPIVDAFIEGLRSFDFGGRHLDVRENVKFFGGNHPRWTHARFPDSACVIAIEFKKFFMDEWSGDVDWDQHALIKRALRSTVDSVMPIVRKMGS